MFFVEFDSTTLYCRSCGDYERPASRKTCDQFVSIKDSRKEARFDKYYKKVLFYQTKSVPWLGNMA